MKLRQILVLGLVLSGVSGLQAQTVVQTVHFDKTATYTEVSGEMELVDSSFFVGTFDPFDSSLGTLDGFVIEWSLANTAIGNLISGGSSVNLMLVGPLTFNGSTYHFVTPVMDVFGGAPNTPISLSVPIAQTHTFSVSETDINYNSAYLDAVMGDEPITLGFGSAVSFSVGGLATFDAVTLGSVTLTYHYTAVPEPSTYAAIFGVLALAAAAWFRRRAAL